MNVCFLWAIFEKNLPADSHTTASLLFFGPLLIPIEKLSFIRDSICKATEFLFFFFHLKKTIDPDGVNIHEETECSLVCYLIIFFNISLSLIYTISGTYYENMLHMLEICLLYRF